MEEVTTSQKEMKINNKINHSMTSGSVEEIAGIKGVVTPPNLKLGSAMLNMKATAQSQVVNVNEANKLNSQMSNIAITGK